MFNFKEDYIAINYHYVQNPSSQWQGIYPCSVDDFEKQIKFISENYNIVSVAEVYQAAQKGQSGKFCAITFDDGLLGQYHNAVPILNRHRATATFFIITSALEKYLPATHKIHVLLSKVTAKVLVDTLGSFLVEFYPNLKDRYFIPLDRRLTERRQHEDLITANFKETLIILPDGIKSRFLGACFKKLHLSEPDISRQFFMGRTELEQLKNQNFIIGNHSHSHYALDMLNDDVLRRDIKLANGILKKLLGEAPTIFSYPHGRSGINVIKVLAEAGFKYAVTIQNRSLSSSDQSMLIPRYDTNDLRDFLNLNKTD